MLSPSLPQMAEGADATTFVSVFSDETNGIRTSGRPGVQLALEKGVRLAQQRSHATMLIHKRPAKKRIKGKFVKFVAGMRGAVEGKSTSWDEK